jgi:monoamine oxidase
MAADVLVIGGGIAGLVAADELSAAGKRVTLIEARDRLGGRIDTRRADGLSAPIELGAEFVHGEHVSTWRYIHEFGLDTYELPQRHERRRHGERSRFPFPDVFDALDRLLDASPGDRLLADVIAERRAAGESPELLAALGAFVESFHAAELDRIGTAGLRVNSSAEEEDGGRQFRLLAGYDGLVRGLAERLAGRGVEIRPTTVVTGIRWRQGSVAVEAREPRGAVALESRAAIVTLPLGVLRAPAGAEGAVEWEPMPAGWRESLSALEMGAAERVVLQFDQAWWNRGDDRPSFVHGPGDSFRIWWTALPRDAPILTGWSGGPRAESLAAADRETLACRALDSLSAVFGRPAAALARGLVALHHHNWTRDPLSRGAYSYPGVGAIEARALLRRPVEATIFLAGEALSDGRNGTVHGAIDDALRVAGAVLRA